MSVKVDKVTKRKKIKEKSEAVAKAYVSGEMLRTDPQGSYTGKPIDKYETPVQDADDL